MLAVYLFVIGFMFQNFEIPSPSMLNTLLVGDHVLVDRTTLASGDEVGAVCALPAGASGVTLLCS